MRARFGRTDWVSLQFTRATTPGRLLEPCLWARGILPANRSSNLPRELGDKQVMFGDFSKAAQGSSTIFTDGSGGPEWALKPLRRVGAGAAAISFAEPPSCFIGPAHVSDVGLLFSQVPGRQTVPRAETWAGAQAIKEARQKVSLWWCDASYTVSGALQSSRPSRCAGANGDVWCALDAQLRASPDLPGASKIKAHQSLECVHNGKLTFAQYLGNGLADVAAGVAAEVFQESAAILTAAEADFSLAVMLNLRLATIEATSWAAATSKLVPRPVLPGLPVLETFEVSLADAQRRMRGSGHQLFKFKAGHSCLRCQRYRSLGRAYMWARLPCIRPPGESGEAAANLRSWPSPSSSAVPAVVARGDAPRIEPVACSGPTGLPPAPLPVLNSYSFDNEEGDPGWFDRAIEEEQAALVPPAHECSPAVEEARASAHFWQPALASDADQLITVTAEQRARKNWRIANAAISNEMREQAMSASDRAVREVAAGSRCQAITAEFDPTAFPPWAERAHSSHDLLWMGGFVFCGFCGSKAAYAINCSKLVSPCSGKQSADSRRAVNRLIAGKLPMGHKLWPDGGANLREGSEIKRVRRLA